MSDNLLKTERDFVTYIESVIMANQWKRWDAKPRVYGRMSMTAGLPHGTPIRHGDGAALRIFAGLPVFDVCGVTHTGVLLIPWAG
jgi:hypothetical protein